MENMTDIIKLLLLSLLGWLGKSFYDNYQDYQAGKKRQNEALEKIKNRYRPDNMSDSYNDLNGRLS